MTASDGVHILALGTGADLWHGRVPGVTGTVTNPVIVNDPARGAIVYVEDYGKLYALVPPPVLGIVGRRAAHALPASSSETLALAKGVEIASAALTRGAGRMIQWDAHLLAPPRPHSRCACAFAVCRSIR